MGATPRPHRFALPMATRSTDVATMQSCPGRWVLTHLRESDQAEASFFILGSALHTAIENAIVFDMDEDWALSGMRAAIDRELGRIADAPYKIESSKRGFDTMHDDAERMLRQFFWSVHPDSPKRLEIYNEYEWPPATEVPFLLPAEAAGTKYPVWGSVDALFTHKVDGVAIVDWKSGTSRQRTDDQLHFYEFGLAGLDIHNAWFHHLDKIQKRSIIQEIGPWPGTAAIRQRIEATEAIKDSIIEGEYPQFVPSFLCNYCPVQHVCPADGDVRARPENAAILRRMLKLARPMIEIDREEREVA